MSLAVYAQENAPDSKKAGGGKKPDDNCGILYGRNHALTFCAPDGWLLDNGIMNDQGIFAVFYPKNSNWEKARKFKTFMYFNVVDMAAKDTVESRMDADVKEELAHDSEAKAKPKTGIQIGNRSIPVLEFLLGGKSGHEAVAYIGESRVLVMVVVSSANDELFKQDYPSFVKLVQSYHFLTSDVNIEHK
jgi:hypothetical protein